MSALAALLVLGAAATACSSDEAVPDVRGRDAVSSTTAASEMTGLGPTTTAVGDEVSDTDAYLDAGLDPNQAACVARSGVDDEFTATPGATPADPLVLESDDHRVEIPLSAVTGTDVERIMLAALAADCAPAAMLERLAVTDGAAGDAAVLDDDLPRYLEQRRSVGANEDEIACLERGFRRAPARLSSLAALPEMIELICVPPERLAQFQLTAIDRSLQAVGVSNDERLCLLSTPEDLVELRQVADALAAGDLEGAGTATDIDAGCVSGQRLFELAVGAATSGVDFGGKALG